jgi:hypothetical protein
MSNKIRPAFVVATQNENGSTNFISAFIGDSKETLQKAVAKAQSIEGAAVWCGTTGQMRYNDACTELELHEFNAQEMALFAHELAWFKGRLVGRFEFDSAYA